MKRLLPSLTCMMLAAAFSTHGASTAIAAPAPKIVAVEGPRVSLAEVVADAPEADLGPAPALAGDRLLTKDDLVAVVISKGGDPKKLKIPAAVRLVRKTKKLAAAELEQELRSKLALKKGATLVAVRAPKSVEIASGWTSVEIATPKLPHKVGSFTTTATITFVRPPEVLGKSLVPIDLSLGPDAAKWDVVAKDVINLVVRKGVVEISAPATAGGDADVGDVLQVTVKSTGRVLQARLVARDRAIALEAP
jgi:hypothetical protein